MTGKSFCIFVVDDDRMLRMIVDEQLSGRGYTVHTFEDGASCMAAMALQPGLILLDIEMPGKNGLEVCREIRDAGFNDVQVMFISGHDDLETLLAAFDAGGNDFISKNALKSLLLRKVEIAVEVEEQMLLMKSQLSNDQDDGSLTAMPSAGDTAIALQFLSASCHCQDIQQLGQLLIETLRHYGVNGLAKLRDGSGEYDFCSEAICTPLEKSILGYISKLGRVSQTDDRLVMNFPRVSVLLTGVNGDDVESIGRLRDHVTILAEGAGARIDAINAEQLRLRDVDAVLEDVDELAGLLGEIESTQRDNHILLKNFAEQYLLQMEDAFVQLGLTPNQETLLRGIADQLSAQLNTLLEHDSCLAQRLNEMADHHKKLLKTH